MGRDTQVASVYTGISLSCQKLYLKTYKSTPPLVQSIEDIVSVVTAVSCLRSKIENIFNCICICGTDLYNYTYIVLNWMVWNE